MEKYIESLITNYTEDIEQLHSQLENIPSTSCQAKVLRTKKAAYIRALNELKSIPKIK